MSKLLVAFVVDLVIIKLKGAVCPLNFVGVISLWLFLFDEREERILDARLVRDYL